MQKITFESFGYDPYDEEDIIKFRVSFVSGLIASSIEFYGYPDTFNEFAENLTSFPKSIENIVTFGNEQSIDDQDKMKWSHSFILKVYCYERNGYTAIEITIDNHQQSPDTIKTKFAIKTVPAEINRLGGLLLRWDPKTEKELIWIC